MDTNRAGVVRALLLQSTFNPTPVAIKSALGGAVKQHNRNRKQEDFVGART
jgi:hypothetical protein